MAIHLDQASSLCGPDEPDYCSAVMLRWEEAAVQLAPQQHAEVKVSRFSSSWQEPLDMHKMISLDLDQRR